MDANNVFVASCVGEVETPYDRENAYLLAGSSEMKNFMTALEADYFRGDVELSDERFEWLQKILRDSIPPEDRDDA